VKIALDRAYNEGPIQLELEIDELHDGAPALLVYLTSSSKGQAEATTVNLGIGAVELVTRSTELRYHAAARLPAARKLRDALVELVADMEAVERDGWAKL
jgi:hypothetical protein